MIITKWVPHGEQYTLFLKRILAPGLATLFLCAAQLDWSAMACLLSASVGLACWLWGIQSLRPKSRVYWSALWMTSIQALHQNWMATTEYTGSVILLGWLLHCLSYGVAFGGWVLCVGSRPSMPAILSLSGLWLLIEWMRPILFFGLGFSWNPMGLMWTAHPWTLQCAALFGLSGLTFWAVATNLFIYRYGWRGLWAPILPFVLGGILYHSDLKERAAPMHILLVQPAKSPWEQAGDVWERLLSLFASHTQDSHDLILLPEGSLPYTAHYPYIPPTVYTNILTALGCELSAHEETIYRSNLDVLQAWSRLSSQSILVGMNDDQQEQGCFNSAFLIRPQHPAQIYHKQWLVPFGEYLPWAFRWVLHWLPIDPGFQKGQGGGLFSYDPPFAVAICYEETLGAPHRRPCRNGAQFLVGLTNDVWYPHSRLPITHLHHARVRAVELGIPMVRACNTGVSCVMDPRGQLLASIPHENRHQEAAVAALSTELPLIYRATPYLFWGDIPIWVCSALASFYLVIKRKMHYSLPIFGSIS